MRFCKLLLSAPWQASHTKLMLQILLIIIFYAEQHLLNSDADQVNYLFRPATQPSSGLFKLKRGIFTVFKLFFRSVPETKAVKTYPTSCILDSKYFALLWGFMKRKRLCSLNPSLCLSVDVFYVLSLPSFSP